MHALITKQIVLLWTLAFQVVTSISEEHTFFRVYFCLEDGGSVIHNLNSHRREDVKSQS